LFNRLAAGKDRKCNGNQSAMVSEGGLGGMRGFIVFETGCSLDTGLYTGTELREEQGLKNTTSLSE